MKFVLASNNKSKLKEMREILEDTGFDVISQGEAGINIEVEETGATFEENAALKAEAAMRLSGLPSIADDSGLCVDVLNGAPGVFSARYGGKACKDDYERTKLLLKTMENESERGAAFVSSIVCVFPDERKITVRGECRGEILCEMRGEGGFGYDPVFYVPEYGMTMAEMPQELKNRMSHRAIALKEFKNKLVKSDLK